MLSPSPSVPSRSKSGGPCAQRSCALGELLVVGCCCWLFEVVFGRYANNTPMAPEALGSGDQGPP